MVAISDWTIKSADELACSHLCKELSDSLTKHCKKYWCFFYITKMGKVKFRTRNKFRGGHKKVKRSSKKEKQPETLEVQSSKLQSSSAKKMELLDINIENEGNNLRELSNQVTVS